MKSNDSVHHDGVKGTGAAKPVPDGAASKSWLSTQLLDAALRLGRQVVAHGDRGPLRAGVPLGAEGRRPVIAAVEAPLLVGTLELAVARAAQEHVLARGAARPDR